MAKIVFTFLLVFSSNILSQTGLIEGKITSAKTHEPLIDAVIIIDGTILGARTDSSGYYQIVQVPVGVYDIKTSQIGYYKKIYEDISVIADSIIKIDFELERIIKEYDRNNNRIPTSFSENDLVIKVLHSYSRVAGGYTFLIKGTGECEFSGRLKTDYNYTGRIYFQLPKLEVINLLRKFSKSSFYWLDNFYYRYWPDYRYDKDGNIKTDMIFGYTSSHNRTNISIRIGDYVKTVEIKDKSNSTINNLKEYVISLFEKYQPEGLIDTNKKSKIKDEHRKKKDIEVIPLK